MNIWKASLVAVLSRVAFCVVATSLPAFAQQAADPAAEKNSGGGAETGGEAGRLKFTTDLQVVAEADHLDVRRDSIFNPDNRIANLATGQVFAEIRPDVTANYRRLSFAVSPRLTVGRRLSAAGDPSDGERFNDFYVNKWRAKMQVTPSLSVSYGREVLQWGNGIFRSLSNPFFVDNGRLNPIRELEGQEFATVAYNPSLSYAISFVSNTGGGRRSASDGTSFHATNAIKFDYVGRAINVTVIGSKQSTESSRLGAAYTYTASDALLFYGELAATRGTPVFYPEPSANPVGWELVPVRADSTRVFITNLIGASYTFRNGLVLTTEYTHNDEGYSSEQAGALSALGRWASTMIAQGGPDAAVAGQLLGRALDTGLRLERRNYLFGQLLKTEYRKRADLSLSYARNLDGGGGTFSAYVTYSLHPRVQLFAVGNRNTGPADTEFGRLQQYAISTGLRLFF